jgi:hypothetical protein
VDAFGLRPPGSFQERLDERWRRIVDQALATVAPRTVS